MSHGGTKYHATAVTAAVLGLLCLPCLLAPLLIGAGFSSVLLLLGPWFVPVLLVLIGVSLVGFFISYRRHKNPLPVLLAGASAALVYWSRYVRYDQRLTYVAVAALLGAIGLDWWVRNRAVCVECAIDRSDPTVKERGIQT